MSKVLRAVRSKLRNPAGRLDTHHIYPKSRTETGFKIHDKRNLVPIDHQMHFGHHAMMWNTTPQEQLVVFAEINKQVLSERAKDLIKQLWELDESEFYKKELQK